MFQFIAGKPLFPSFVQHARAEFDEALAAEANAAESSAFESLLANCVPKRRAEFLAGRRCARRAMAEHAPEAADRPLAAGADRAPVWPDGLVGSITHARADAAHGYAAAVVALASRARGIGLDTEVVLSPSAFANVKSSIATSREIDETKAALGIDECAAATLIFSAKESVYKCLYPAVKRYFGFFDAGLTTFDTALRIVTLQILSDLSDDVRAGLQLSVRYEFELPYVHTGVVHPFAAENSTSAAPAALSHEVTSK